MKLRRLVFLIMPLLIVALAASAGDEEEIPSLIQRLGGFDRAGYQAASAKLVEIGKPAVPALIQALKDPEPGVRARACRILVDLKVEEAIIPIGEVIGDSQNWVARSAVYALGNSGSAAVIPLLQKALGHSHASVREAALYGLERLSAKSSLPDISRLMLSDPDQYVRWRAMRAIRKLEAGAEIKAMLQTFDDSEAPIGVRWNAATFLGELRVKEALPLLLKRFDSADEGLRWRVIEAAGRIGGPEVAEAVVKKLGDSSLTVRMYAIGVLGKLGDARAVQPLAGLLKDANPQVRMNAIRALGRIGGENAAKAVRQSLSDGAHWVRALAVETLVDLKSREHLEAIKLLAKDGFPLVRSAVMSALGELGGQDEIGLVKAGTGDDNFWVQEEARAALTKLQPKE